MKKTEKIVGAVLTIALGVLLIVLRGDLIGILMTVLGVGLIALGIMDIVNGNVSVAVVKLIVGGLVIFCGWVIVQAVLYVVAAALLIAGILMLYEKVKSGICFENVRQVICEYAPAVMFIVIGALLFFNQGNTVQWVFVVSGVFTIVEGGLLLINAFME